MLWNWLIVGIGLLAIVAAGVLVARVHRLPPEERTRAATEGQFILGIVGVGLTLVGFLAPVFGWSPGKGDGAVVTIPKPPSVTGSGMITATPGTATGTPTAAGTVANNTPGVTGPQPGGGGPAETATRTTARSATAKPPAASTVLFRDAFGNSGSGWSVGVEAHGVERYVSGGIPDPGLGPWLRGLVSGPS